VKSALELLPCDATRHGIGIGKISWNSEKNAMAIVCAPVCLSDSVCLSVTLRHRDHIGWNSGKIISRLISRIFLLSTDPRPKITDLFQREHSQILAGIGMGYGKIDSWRTKPAISPKRLKIERQLLTYY